MNPKAPCFSPALNPNAQVFCPAIQQYVSNPDAGMFNNVERGLIHTNTMIISDINKKITRLTLGSVLSSPTLPAMFPCGTPDITDGITTPKGIDHATPDDSLSDCISELSPTPFDHPTPDVSHLSENGLEEGEEDSAYLTLSNVRLKNVNKIIIGHMNINSIRNKFEPFSDLVNEKLDIILISETKIDSTFPKSQFHIQGYSPHRLDRNAHGCRGWSGKNLRNIC